MSKSTSPILTPLPTPGDIASTELSYYSDYFSFVGRDEEGLVAFALDTNRGRDGDDYQAEHFVESTGSGASQEVKGFLAGLPDSGRQSIWHLRSGDYRLAPGFYLWPSTWKLDITDKETTQAGPSTLANSAWQERDGHTLATWVIGGFRMGIASGELSVADRRYRVYGLSELIK